MAIADEWDEVDRAFDRLEQHRVLHSTLAAMRQLVEMIRHDAAFADVHPRVSMASILFSRGQSDRRAMVEWDEESGYRVMFVDPGMELAEPTLVHEDEVLEVLRKYLDSLGA